MKPKLYRGNNDSSYAKRRLAEIRQQEPIPYQLWRGELLAIAEILTVPKPAARRLVRR